MKYIPSFILSRVVWLWQKNPASYLVWGKNEWPKGWKASPWNWAALFPPPSFAPKDLPRCVLWLAVKIVKKMEKEISLDVWLYHLLTKTHFGFGQSQKIRFSIDLNFSFVSSIVIVKLTQSDKINSKLGLLAQSYSNRKYYVLYGINFLFGFKLNMGKAASFVCLSKREKKGHVLWSKITLHKPKRKIVKKSGM